MALWWPCGGFGVALYSGVYAEYMPSIWLCGGFVVALWWLCGGFRWLSVTLGGFVGPGKGVARTPNPNEARNPAPQFALRHPPNATPSFRQAHRIRNRENA